MSVLAYLRGLVLVRAARRHVEAVRRLEARGARHRLAAEQRLDAAERLIAHA